MFELTDCVILHGPELAPHRCRRFAVKGETIAAIELGEPCLAINKGTLVIMPALYNSHTHIGDSCMPDGATGMTLEQGFFRPDGYKYRKLAEQNESDHLEQIPNHLEDVLMTARQGQILWQDPANPLS